MITEKPTIAASAVSSGADMSSRTVHYGLILLFVISGVAALIYQIRSQRLLFEGFGVDMESVTIIVSACMLALGVGAIAGGELADRYPDRVVGMFTLIELATAAFGFCSLFLIHAVSAAVVNSSLPAIAAANFGLSLIPATLMGATLPFVRKSSRMIIWSASIGTASDSDPHYCRRCYPLSDPRSLGGELGIEWYLRVFRQKT